jgi:hypothetical protein
VGVLALLVQERRSWGCTKSRLTVEWNTGEWRKEMIFDEFIPLLAYCEDACRAEGSTLQCQKFKSKELGKLPFNFGVYCSTCGNARRPQLICCITLPQGIVKFWGKFRHCCRHIPWKRVGGDDYSNFFSLKCPRFAVEHIRALDAGGATRTLMKRLAKMGVWPTTIEAYLESAYDPKYAAKRKLKAESSDASVQGLIEGQFRGFTRVYLLRDANSEREDYWPWYLPVLGKKRICAFAWVPQWGVSAAENAGYFQLDASFYGTRPYCYCVVQALIHNEAVPVALVVGPTEKHYLYEVAYECLEKAGVSREMLNKPVLSDQGSGLRAFCKSRGIEQFFCHRHLIEKFGSSSLCGELVAQALFCKTKQEFEAYLEQAVSDIARAIESEVITEAAGKELLKFLGYKDGNSNNDPIAFEHGMWNRAGLGISTCSNHAERFHRSVNSVTILKDPSERLRGIRQCMNDRFIQYDGRKKDGKGPRRQAKEELQKLRKKAERLLPGEKSEKCQNAKCEERCATFAKRFGLDSFPCKHTFEHICLDDKGNFKFKFDRLPIIQVNIDLNEVEVKWAEWRDWDLPAPKELEPTVSADEIIESAEILAALCETDDLYCYLYRLINAIYRKRNEGHTYVSKTFFDRNALFEKIWTDWEERISGGEDASNRHFRSRFTVAWWQKDLSEFWVDSSMENEAPGAWVTNLRKATGTRRKGGTVSSDLGIGVPRRTMETSDPPQVTYEDDMSIPPPEPEDGAFSVPEMRDLVETQSSSEEIVQILSLQNSVTGELMFETAINGSEPRMFSWQEARKNFLPQAFDFVMRNITRPGYFGALVRGTADRELDESQ